MRQLTEAERKAANHAFGDCSIESGPVSQDRALFHAGFVAGLDFATAQLSNRYYHTLERGDGSTCVYYTLQGDPAHYVVYDTLDEGAK